MPELTRKKIEQYQKEKKIEGSFLDFKSTLNDQDLNEKFLDDICAFANGRGGIIIYGVEEGKNSDRKGTGLINKFNFFSIDCIDNLKLKIGRKIEIGIRPKLFSYNIYPVQFDDDECLLVIQIYSSIMKPHMVHQTGRFHIRMPSGNELMDIDIVKNQILDSELLEQKMKNFHIERLSKLLSNDNSIIQNDKEIGLIIDVVPFNSLSKDYEKIDLRNLNIQEYEITQKFYGYNCLEKYRFNLDGIFTSNTNSYIQFFKNGIIELFTNNIFDFVDKNRISSSILKRNIILIKECLEFYKKISFSQQNICVFISLFGIKNKGLFCCQPFIDKETKIFDRNIINLSEIIINSFENNIEELIQPLLSDIAYASGFSDFPT